MLKVLIAVDGSTHAQHAIETVGRLARAGAAVQVSLINVRNGPVFYGELPAISAEEVDRAQRKSQEELLDNAQARALALGLTLGSIEHAEGLPAQEIARTASELGVDQVVMGTHGRGAMGSLFMGSVAQQVVHLVKVPVLLVR